MESYKEAVEQSPVIFYDGECGVCDRFVQWVMPRDKQGVFRFAPLQGTTAQSLMQNLPEDPKKWSIFMFDENGQHEASTAVLLILKRLNWGVGLPNVAMWIPRLLRDMVYAFVARHRYRWFGKPASCPLLPAHLRHRFLP